MCLILELGVKVCISYESLVTMISSKSFIACILSIKLHTKPPLVSYKIFYWKLFFIFSDVHYKK